MSALPPIPARVAAGVRWLDTHAPTDWPWLVQLHDFDMSSGCQCVLGWVFDEPGRADDRSGFGWAASNLQLPDHPFVVLGFDVYERQRQEYAALTEEWRATILRLRAERQAEHDEARAQALIDEIEDQAALDVLPQRCQEHGALDGFCARCAEDDRDDWLSNAADAERKGGTK